MSYRGEHLRGMTDDELRRERARIQHYRAQGVATLRDEETDHEIGRELARREFERENPTPLERVARGLR